MSITEAANLFFSHYNTNLLPLVSTICLGYNTINSTKYPQRCFTIICNQGRRKLAHIFPNRHQQAVKERGERREMTYILIAYFLFRLKELRVMKRDIQILLRNFQDEFTKENGRPVQNATDRDPIKHEYQRYKDIKNEILELEAKLAKNNQ